MNDDQGRSENFVVGGGAVLLVQYSREGDHFVGVEGAVTRGGARCVRVTEQNADVIAQEVARAGERGDGVVIVVKDTESPLAQYAMRARDAARRVRVALMMDGIVEYRNTFVNPWVPKGFLHAMPVDAVFAAVEEDAARLLSWGNHAVATGLPRLSGIARTRTCADRTRDKVMVATARRAAFSDEEFATLRGALERVRDALVDEIGEERIVWRLTEGLDGLLGVVNDTRGLTEAMGECGVVMTTPSTLMLEARLMGARVAILHPWETPLWQRSAWVVRRGDAEEIRGVLRPSEKEKQEEATAVVGMTDAAERVAGEILRLLETRSAPNDESVGKVHARTTREHVGVGARVTPSALSRGSHARKQARVVNLLSVDGSPVGGVTSWALRLAREMPKVRSEYDVRTLAVVSSPEALWGRGFDLNPDGTTEFCHLHPLMDAHERVERVCESLRAMAPEIVLQNYADHCAMAAMIVRAESQGHVRVINIAHTDVGYYRDLAERYDQYDGAIGVSPSCMAWLNELRDGRPTDEIVYGVPVSDCPREVLPTGPLRICYVGRMVEEQKRIGLLWRVVDGLEADPGTDADSPLYELHLIGDGPELAAFAKHAATRTLRRGRIVLHGRQGMEQVESLVRGMDVSILVSIYEGTSVTMLEAMGQGVVPCVTRVNSGVDRWVRDGVNGIVVGVDDVDAMSARLRVLAHNRSLLAEMGRAAWERIRGNDRQPGSSLAEMARAYAGVFDRVRAAKAYHGGTPGCFMRPMDAWRWQKTWCDDPSGCAAWCERTLRRTGCTRVLRDPSDAVLAGLESRGSDRVGVVLTDARECSLDVGVLDDLRSRGVVVAVSPMLAQDGVTARLLRGIEGLRAEGCARVAVYGTGHHTQRCRAVFVGNDAPIVGFIDDQAKPGGGTECFGLPVVRLEEAEKLLGIDGVVLSSDAFEARMWARCEGIRERGVRVASLYGAGSNVAAGV